MNSNATNPLKESQRQVFWQKSGNDRAFLVVGCIKQIAQSAILNFFENMTLAACGRQHFWVFCMSFGVFILAETRCLELATNNLLTCTHS